MYNNTSRVFDDEGNLIAYLSGLAKAGKYVFRGYSTEDQMLPSIIRNKAVDFEARLLKEFERYGAHYFHTNNPVEFMAYAQHYGLSTRLLDFSYNPFIALYFSLYRPKLRSYKSDDRDYYYLAFCNIEDNICLNNVYGTQSSTLKNELTMTDRCVDIIKTIESVYRDQLNITEISSFLLNADGLSKINIDKISRGKLLYVDPNQSNQRLIMQQGLFLVPYTLSKEKFSNTFRQNVSIIKIHRTIRKKLNDYLNTLGINAFRLMPDLASVCCAVEKKVKEESSGDYDEIKMWRISNMSDMGIAEYVMNEKNTAEVLQIAKEVINKSDSDIVRNAIVSKLSENGPAIKELLIYMCNEGLYDNELFDYAVNYLSKTSQKDLFYFMRRLFGINRNQFFRLYSKGLFNDDIYISKINEIVNDNNVQVKMNQEILRSANKR